MKDETQRDSSTSREFKQRFDGAMTNEWVEKTLNLKQLIKAGKLPASTEINNKNAELAWATGTENNKVPTVKGVSKAETSLMERISAVTERPENDTTYRTAQKVNEHLTHKNNQLAEDKRRQKQYEAVLKASMQPDPYYS